MSDAPPVAGFRLVPILADGSLGDAALAVPGDLAPLLAQTRALHARTGYRPPWIGYVAVESGQCVGGGAFFAPPRDGTVEIAYFTLPGREGRGHAGRTAAALVSIAREAAPQVALLAKTLPEENASTRILTRLGFLRDGMVEDHEIGPAWRWRLAPGPHPPEQAAAQR